MTGASVPLTPKRPAPPDWVCLALLAAAGAALFFLHLGTPGLMDPDEGRYAEIAREMLATGDWLVPRLNFVPYLEKPPLGYWLTAISFRVFGATEWAARLPAALAAFLGLYLVFWLGRAWWGARAGLMSALVLATCGGYVILGRLAILDMPLTFLLSLGVGLGYEAARRGQRRLLIPAYLALALGVLTKGPVALVLPMLIWGALSLICRRPPLSFWAAPLGLALMAAVVLPWFVLITLKIPEFPRFFLWEHHVARYAAGAFHRQPLYFYLPVLAGLMLPWSWLLPWAVGRLRPGASPERLFLLAWAGVVLAFFSLSTGKLVPYILPALPPLALLLGESLAALGSADAAPKRPAGLTVSLIIWAVIAGSLVFLYLWPPPPVSRALVKAQVLRPVIPLGLMILAAAPVLALAAHRLSLLLAGALLISALVPWGMDKISGQRSPRELGLALQSRWRPGAALVGIQAYSQAISFYSGQPFHLLKYRGELDFGLRLAPEKGFVVARPEDLGALVQARPQTFFYLKAGEERRFRAWFPGELEEIARQQDCLLLATRRK